MESEYMSEFKRTFNTAGIRNSFREKVAYRRNRRVVEHQHQRFGDMQDPEDVEEEEELYLNGMLSKDKGQSGIPPPDIPALELRATPSPAESDSGLDSDRFHRSPSKQTRATQTSIRPDASIDQDRLNRPFDHARKTSVGNGPISMRGRSRSPFAAYGNGDREMRTSGKRTFNVKATDGVQVYETAVRAAARKGYPLPQRSRKLELLNPRKGTTFNQHHLNHARTFPSKKNVVFDC